MPITNTPRVGMVRWSDDSDQQFRAQFTQTVDALEALAALYRQGTAATRPAASAALAGSLYASTDTGAVDYCTGTAWLALVQAATAKTLRVDKTYTVSGAVNVDNATNDYYLPPFTISLAAGQTGKLVALRSRILAGTSVTFDVRVNGAAAAGFSALSATTTKTLVDPADVVLAEGDEVSVFVTAVAGTPKGLYVDVYLELTA